MVPFIFPLPTKLFPMQFLWGKLLMLVFCWIIVSAPNGWHLTVHQAKSVEGMMRRQKVVASKNDHNIDDDARLRNDTISRGNISRSRVMCGPWSIRLQHEVTILKCKSSRQQNYFNSRTNTAASRTNASYLEDKSKLSWEQMREMCRRNPVGPFLGHQLCQAGPPHAFTLLSLLVVTNLLYLCWP